MANKVRGETSIEIGGVSYTVSLGMGALAEIEDAFGVESFEEALQFGDKVSAKALQKLLIAILAGNEITITDDLKLAVKRMTMQEFMEIITAVMSLSGLDAKAGGKSDEGAGPLAVKSAGRRG